MPNFDPAPTYNVKDDVYNPDLDQMVNTLLSAVMLRPGKALPPEYGSFLLHALEAYRTQKSDLMKLQADMDEEQRGRLMDQDVFERTASLWEAEKDDYKAEIKRLEHLLEAEMGLQGVVRARTDSLLKRDDVAENGDDSDVHTPGGNSLNGRQHRSCEIAQS